MSERSIEAPWATRLAIPPTLDVGHVESTYLCALPWPVDGIDLRRSTTTCVRQAFEGDIRWFEFEERYQTVLAISTIEHVGLKCGTYGTTEDDPEKGDRRALEGCLRACLPQGQVLVSVPFGRPVDFGWFRQYDRRRLAELTDGLEMTYQVYAGPPWRPVEPGDAEDLTYDHDGASARAVALVTIQGSRA